MQPVKYPLPSTLTVGPVIGQYNGRPIWEHLTDNHGIRRFYDGVAQDARSIPSGAILAGGVVYVPQNRN